MQKKKYLFVLLFLSRFCLVFGQTESAGGLPFLHNFSPKNYLAAPQNWSLSGSPEGLVYVANNDCLLEFDGTGAKRIEIPYGICRSVAVNNSGTIFVGLQNDFGYFEPDSIGKLTYLSLKNKLSSEDQDFTDVWETVILKEKTIFCSRKKVYFYDGKSITVSTALKNFNFFFPIGQRLLSEEDSLGLVEIKEEKPRVLPGGEFYIGKKIRGVLPYDNSGKLLIITVNGLYIYAPNGESEVFESEAEDFIRNNIPFCAALTPDGNFAVGTFRGGLIILNSSGKTISFHNEETGLQSNSIRKMTLDRENGLWLALNDGISRIDLYSPWKMTDHFLGLKGSLNKVLRTETDFLVGTSLGIYKENELKHQESSENYQAVEGFKDQLWCFINYKNEQLIGCNEGLFALRNGNPVKIYPEGAFSLLELSDGRLVGGMRNGLQVFDYQNNTIRLVYRTKKIIAEIETLAEGADGSIWAGSKTYGLSRLIEKNGRFEEEHFGPEHGLTNSRQVDVFRTSQGLWFSTPKAVFKFENGRFIPLNIDLQGLTEGNEILQITEDKLQNHFWIHNGRQVAFVIPSGNAYKQLPSFFSRLPEGHIKQIYPEKDFVWVVSSEALYRWERGFKSLKKGDFRVFIREVSLIQNKETVLFSPKKTEKTVFDFSRNSLRFRFASNSFEKADAVKYSCFLEGYESSWSEWNSEIYKDYTRLPAGNYTLKVKARDVYGKISEEEIFEFEIEPPFYLSKPAYALYVLSILLLVYLGFVFFSRQLVRKNKKLEALVRERTSEIYQQNEELETQKNNLEGLNKQIEQSLDNINLISEIGREITALLSAEAIVESLYVTINRLTDAQIFAVGIFNETEQCLDFIGAESDKKVISKGTDKLSETKNLSVKCFTEQKAIRINDFENEYADYLDKKPDHTKLTTQSLIYIPLKVKGKKIGVITIQSLHKNAYTQYHHSVLETLASYIAIAIDNAKAYNEIENTNQRITSSIRYAQTIQEAILPDTAEMTKNFREHFIIFRPKDVVSGDFYWLSGQDNKLFFALADCTGHGVPGGFMSMVGHGLLNESVNEKKIFAPAEVLLRMQKGILNTFRRSGKYRDGMDISIISIEQNEDGNFKICFAGAKLSLCYISAEEQELKVLKGDRFSLGKTYNADSMRFEEQSIILPPSSLIYLITDGYSDQANPDRQRIGGKAVKKMFAENAALSMSEQKKCLENYLDRHSKNTAQRDDISVIGLKL